MPKKKGENYSAVLLDIVVGEAETLFRRYGMCRRRKRADALVKPCQCRLRTPWPSIHLANLPSLPNKTIKLLLLSRTNKDFSNSAAPCFTETWLNDVIPDSALNLPCFQNAGSDVQKLADQITWTEQKHPDSVLILLGDINKANLSREMPKAHHLSHQKQ